MSRNRTRPLLPRQLRFLEALMACGGIKAACEATGIPRRTATRWLASPEFQRALAEAERAALADLLRELLALAGRAAEALSAGLEADDLRLRLRSADLLLARLLQARGLVELEERLARLEEAVARLEGGD